MTRQPSFAKDTLVDVWNADQEGEPIQKAYAALPHERLEISLAAYKSLIRWHLPRSSALAAIASPLLEYGLVEPDLLRETFGQETIDIARQFLAWQAIHPIRTAGSASHYSLELRQLIRQVYLTLPHLSFIPLLMAQHDAHLKQLPADGAEQQAIAAKTQHVFIPLLEMLGMWNLRNEWMNCYTSVLAPAEYQKMKLEWLPKWQTEKAVAYTLFKKRFARDYDLFQEQAAGKTRPASIGPRPRLQLIERLPGPILRRGKEDESSEELASRLSIRIFCKNVSECYLVLGVVHGLGKPIAPRFSERFDDYLAAPQYNGYRALHTAILFEDKPASVAGRNILIELRILTPAMHRLNERGILETFTPRRHPDTPASWNQSRLDELTGQLRNQIRKLRDKESNSNIRQDMTQSFNTDIQHYMTEFDIGTRSNPLYVFTPRGEVLFLDEGSTPIDFAYQIHTEVAQHIDKIKINDMPAPVNYILQNGDIVNIQTFPDRRGPDFSWLDFAVTAHAKAQVRRGLMNHARSIHEGRAIVDEALINIRQKYWAKKHYKLALTTDSIDKFFLRRASIRGYTTPQPIYEKIASGEDSAAQWISHLISTELAIAVAKQDGEPLPYPSHRLSFCEQCLPVPGESIIGCERRLSAQTRGLTIHVEGSTKCLGQASPTRQMPICWKERISQNTSDIALFQVRAENRYGILADVLDTVYQNQQAKLHKVEAQESSDGAAEIDLAVGYTDLAQLADIQKAMEAIGSVRQVSSFLSSAAQHLALIPLKTEYQYNPYSPGLEVYDRTRFYDRRAPVEEILKWLRVTPSVQKLILYGQHQVGKTSLVKYLMYEILPQFGTVLPVYMTFQGLTKADASAITEDAPLRMADIAAHLARRIYESLNKPLPQKHPWEEPLPWLNRIIGAVLKELRKQRLFVIIDEFDALLDYASEGWLDPTVFADLRTIMNMYGDINWLLIIENSHLHSPELWGDDGIPSQEFRTLLLLNFEHQWAEKLIQEPMLRLAGIQFGEEALAHQIVDLTAGNPYLIQLICYYLVARVRGEQRTNITKADLEHTVRLISSQGNRFLDQLMHNLHGLPKVLLSTLASRAQTGEWQDIALLTTHLQKKRKRLDGDTLHSAFQALEAQGIVALRNEGDIQQVSIPIQLFHAWVRDYIKPASAYREWQAAQKGSPNRQKRGS